MDFEKYPEAKCLLQHTKDRMKNKKGMIMIFTGETGEGKSYAGLRLLELWYKEWFNEEFPIQNVCNNIEEAIILVRNFKRIGEGIMIEELSAHASKREPLTTSNVYFNKFTDICRIKQAVIIGNAPHLSFIDSHLPMVCQNWINCEKVDFKNKIVLAHPLWFQTFPHKKEPYKHRYLNKKGDEIDYIYLRLADEKLIKEYDKLKEEGNENIFDEIILKLRHNKIKQIKKWGKGVLTPKEIEVYQFLLDGFSEEDIAKKIGYKNERVVKEVIRKIKNKLKNPKYVQISKEMPKKKEITIKINEKARKKGLI